LLLDALASRSLMKTTLEVMRLAQASGLLSLLAESVAPWLPQSLAQLHNLLPPLSVRRRALPEMLRPVGKARARVALFTGCVADAAFPETNWAAAKVLQWNGCEVWIPRRQTCCGAMHDHAGRHTAAQDRAIRNCEVFSDLPNSRRRSLDAVIVTAAGCGAMLKDYGRLLAGTSLENQGQVLADRARDISEFLMELGPLRPRHPLSWRATYHDACHLCHAQQIRQPPRQLLQMIPGLEVVPLAESELCCGAAGTYSLTQPEMADRLGRRKVDNILATSARAVFASNVGCLLQIGRYLRPIAPTTWLAHPIDALWRSYHGKF
jgi:glycolate oxidase iron-sulfur subunit